MLAGMIPPPGPPAAWGAPGPAHPPAVVPDPGPGLRPPDLPAGRPPSALRRVLSVAGTVVAVATTWFSGMLGTAFSFPGDVTGGEALMGMLGFALAIGVATVVVWRSRYPVAVCLVGVAAGVLTPLGAVAALLALPWVWARADARRIAWCTVATVVAVVVSLGRDVPRAQPVFSLTAEDGSVLRFPLAVYVVVGSLALAASVGAGLVRRTARRAATAQRTAAVETRRAETLRDQADSLRVQADGLRAETDHLRTELTRQDERELIAREMHDTVAHHLSLVSLQASALEITTDDPDAGEAARTMRSSARRALEEMRTLISSLRDGSEGYSGVTPTLGDLARLLDDARGAGVDLLSTVFVTDADAAPPALTRAVYRVVQEALTNVTKHAPGARAEVDVRARPGDGVDVVVRNALPGSPYGTEPGVAAGAPAATPAPALPGAGAGILGMRERCDALGGTFSALVEGSQFVVRAHLPWPRTTP